MIDYDKPILDENNNPIKIGMLANHWCVRVYKRAKSLMNLGYEVFAAGDKDSYGADEVKVYYLWHNEKQLKNVVREMINNGVRILDFNNEPSYPVEWIRDVITDMNVGEKVKLVVDFHDLDSIRRGFIPKDERIAFNCADGIIYVSLPIRELSNRLHRVTVPNTVIYSYCNKDVIKYDEIKDRHGLVYQGGANPPGDNEMNQIFSYRSLYDIITRLVDMGNETYMYCGNMSAYETYQNTGAVLHPPTIYNEMMKGMLQYKYGILIFNNEDGKKDQVNYTLANKFFEYVACGLPVLACWCPENSKLVDKWKVGYVFNHINEIGDCSQLETRYLETLDNIKEFNSKVYMENFICRIENLYADVLGVERKGMPDKIKELNVFEYGENE